MITPKLNLLFGPPTVSFDDAIPLEFEPEAVPDTEDMGILGGRMGLGDVG
jgi:hypothetical protein